MKKGRRAITLADLPPKYREMAEKQLSESPQTGQTASLAPNVALLTASGVSDPPKAKKRGKKRREINATEEEFLAFIRKEFLTPSGSVAYESITLRWGDGAGILTYTPDFVLRLSCDTDYFKHIFFEVKGAWAWEKDIVKFKAARAQFPEYEFQLWEKDAEGRWTNTI